MRQLRQRDRCRCRSTQLGAVLRRVHQVVILNVRHTKEVPQLVQQDGLGVSVEQPAEVLPGLIGRRPMR